MRSVRTELRSPDLKEQQDTPELSPPNKQDFISVTSNKASNRSTDTSHPHLTVRDSTTASEIPSLAEGQGGI